ncbi:transcription factor org2 [Quercus suber]|uniref:Transcription factor org2 n=1 Tax=Quercus suber TaxID=58331 RepID=A0AAW0LVE1_QUESU
MESEIEIYALGRRSQIALKWSLQQTDEKLSIPATVSRMVKYIAELQQQVDILIQRKEELISRICRQGEQIHQENQRQIASWSSLSAISTYKVHKSPLAEILPNLEEDGFLILNASSFESFGGRVFYNLHLQAERTYALKREVLSEKLLSFSERGEEINYENLGSIYFNDDLY